MKSTTMNNNNTTSAAPSANVTTNLSALNINDSSNNSAATSEQIVEDPHTESGKGTHTPMDTTMFIEDGNIVRRDESRINTIEDSLLSISNSDPDYQNIKSFLAKPIILRTGTFATTDTYSLLLTNLLPYSLFSAAQAAVWVQKLSGVYGIRFDMRFKLVVNANRFQQGRYILGYVPLCSPVKSTSNLKEFAVVNMHLASIVQRTTVHHVEVDLCDDTTCELLVPFQSVQPFYNFNQFLRGIDDQVLGAINIYPYSPLVSPAGSTSAGFTLYVSLENVTLFGAASAQAGGPKKGVSDKEVSNTANGPISGAAHAIAKGFKEFAKIPLLSEYALPVSWIADRVANVASVFGFAKPTQGDSLQKVMILSAPNHTTVDGDSDARTMSFLSKPGVAHLDGLSRTEYDEMDFSYICKKSAWFETATWSTSQIVGTAITSINNTPRQQSFIGGNLQCQPVSFVNNFFAQWRGSLVYRFKFVRTEFHSGRIQIAFYPGITGGVLTGNAAYVHRLIVDIRESSEVTFTVPFLYQSLWCEQREATGTIIVSVIDPLVAPATVSTSVTILMEISGGDDIEFAIPKDFGYLPTLMTPQAGDVSEISNVVIGGAMVNANPLLATSISIGDKMTSFRSLLRRFYPVRYRDNALNKMNGAAFTSRVDWIGILDNGVELTNSVMPDTLSLIGSCYGLWRGGVRVRNVVNSAYVLAANEGNTRTPSIFLSYTRNENSAANSNEVDPFYTVISTFPIYRPDNVHVIIQDLRNNSVVTTEVPQYSRFYGRAIADCISTNGTATTYRMNDSTLGSTTQVELVSVPPYTSTLTENFDGRNLHNLFRAMADDGNFSIFISVPALRAPTGSVNGHATGFW